MSLTANLSSHWRRSLLILPKCVKIVCAASGLVCAILLLSALAVSGQLPPIPPYLDAEETATHYQNHERGTRAGAALLVIAGLFYLPRIAIISQWMLSIPSLPLMVSVLHLVSGALSSLAVVLSGIILGVANYRLSRPAEVTQALSDLFWIEVLLSWPFFAAQNLSFAYAIILDSQPKPTFPKAMAVPNLIAPILYVPCSAVHIATTGAVAWNITFWLMSMPIGVNMVLESIYIGRRMLCT